MQVRFLLISLILSLNVVPISYAAEMTTPPSFEETPEETPEEVTTENEAVEIDLEEKKPEITQSIDSHSQLGLEVSVLIDLLQYANQGKKSYEPHGGAGTRMLLDPQLASEKNKSTQSHAILYGVGYHSAALSYQKDNENSYDLMAQRFSLVASYRFARDRIKYRVDVDAAYEKFNYFSNDDTFDVSKNAKDGFGFGLLGTVNWNLGGLQVGPVLSFFSGNVQISSLAIQMGLSL